MLGPSARQKRYKSSDARRTSIPQKLAEILFRFDLFSNSGIVNCVAGARERRGNKTEDQGQRGAAAAASGVNIRLNNICSK